MTSDLEASTLQRKLAKKCRDNQQNGWEYLQTMQLMEDFYAEGKKHS